MTSRCSPRRPRSGTRAWNTRRTSTPRASSERRPWESQPSRAPTRTIKPLQRRLQGRCPWAVHRVDWADSRAAPLRIPQRAGVRVVHYADNPVVRMMHRRLIMVLHIIRARLARTSSRRHHSRVWLALFRRECSLEARMSRHNPFRLQEPVGNRNTCVGMLHVRIHQFCVELYQLVISHCCCRWYCLGISSLFLFFCTVT